jgi:hypothetical protein
VCLDVLVYFQAGPLHVGIFRWPDCCMVGHTCVDLSVLLLASIAPLADTLVDGWYHILPGDVEVDGDGDGGGDSDSDSGGDGASDTLSDNGYGENGGLYYCESRGGADERGEGGSGGSSAASVGRASVGQIQVSVRPRLRLAPPHRPPHRGSSHGEEAETRAGVGTGVRVGAVAGTGSGGRWKWMTQGPNNGSPPRQGSAEDTGISMGTSMGSSMGGLGSFGGNHGHMGWTGMAGTSTAGYMDVPPFPVPLGPRGGGGGGGSTWGVGRATRLAVPVVVAGGGGATPPLVGFVAGRSDRAWDAFTSCLHDLSLG